MQCFYPSRGDEWTWYVFQMSTMTFIVWASLGGVTGSLNLYIIQRLIQTSKKTWTERQAWSLLLATAAAIYVGFAVLGGAPVTWLGIELAGLLFYGGLAMLGARGWIGWLGVGWLLHMLWDVWLHHDGHPGYVPSWYVPGCLGYDIVVGLRLLIGAGALSAQPTTLHAEASPVRKAS